MQNARVEQTGILIDDKGDWFSKDKKKIINTEILTYFKKNLHRDDSGVFIFNEFGKLAEKGYIVIEGPPLMVVSFDHENIFLDNGEKQNIVETSFFWGPGDRPLIIYNPLNVWAGFQRQAYQNLATRLHERGTVIHFEEKNIHILTSIDWKNPKRQ